MSTKRSGRASSKLDVYEVEIDKIGTTKKAQRRHVDLIIAGPQEVLDETMQRDEKS